MHWLPQVTLSNLVELVWVLPSPELDSGVPPSRNDDCCVVLMKHVEVLDRLRVSSDIDDGVAGQIPLLDVVVCAGK